MKSAIYRLSPKLSLWRKELIAHFAEQFQSWNVGGRLFIQVTSWHKQLSLFFSSIFIVCSYRLIEEDNDCEIHLIV